MRGTLSIFHEGTATATDLDNVQHLQHGVLGTLTVDGQVYHVFAMYAPAGQRVKYPRISLDMPADAVPAQGATRRARNANAKAWAAPALRALGMPTPGTWDRNAGCSCGCSPAYVYRSGAVRCNGRHVEHLTVAAAPVLDLGTVARLAVPSRGAAGRV